MAAAGISRGLSHVTVNVSNMENAKRFYRTMLGWEQEFSITMGGPEFDEMVGVAGAAGEIAGGTIGDNRLELVCMNFVTESNGEGLGLSRLVFEVDDVEDAWRRAAEAGVSAAIVPHEFPGCRLVTVRDPDGTAIQFIEYLPGGDAWGGLGGRPQLRT